MEKGQTFEEFVMQCARAFGPCISMRDDPLDKPIPDKLPESYYERAYREAKEELTKLDAMDSEARLKEGKRLQRWHINYSKKAAERSKAEDERLRQMQEEIKTWEPPTKDHKALQDFMLQQISISFNNNGAYHASELARYKSKSPMEFFEESYEMVKARVTRGESEAREAAKNRRNAEKWLRDLRRSVANHKRIHS